LTPQELKQLFDQKRAELEDEAAKVERARKREITERAERHHRALAAIKSVALPYLAEIARAFGPGEFSYGPITEENRDVIGAEFRIGNGIQFEIREMGGRISVTHSDLRLKGTAGSRPTVTIPPNQEPFIGAPDDLTSEKLGKLVQMAIEYNFANLPK
jgi:hypothetical protein